MEFKEWRNSESISTIQVNRNTIRDTWAVPNGLVFFTDYYCPYSLLPSKFSATTDFELVPDAKLIEVVTTMGGTFEDIGYTDNPDSRMVCFRGEDADEKMYRFLVEHEALIRDNFKKSWGIKM